MEVIIFDFWLLIIISAVLLGFWKKNAIFLLVAGLLTVAFGNVLTFDGLRVVNGFNTVSGTYNYLTLLPINDQLIAMISIVTLPLGIALALFSLVVFFSEAVQDYRLWNNV